MITKTGSKRFLGLGLVAAVSLLVVGCPSPFGYFASEEERTAQFETGETAPPESVSTPYIVLSSGGEYAASSFDFSGTSFENLATYQGVPVAHDIKLATQTDGADIFYTTDGSAVTPNSGTTRKFDPTQSIRLEGNGNSVFIRAIGLKTLYYPSPVSSMGVKIQWDAAAQPVFAVNGSVAGLGPDGINYFDSPVNITISTSDGSTVHYVMSSDPTGVQPLNDTGVTADDVLNYSAKQVYSGAISIPAGEYRKIWAVSTGNEKTPSPAVVNAFEFAVRPPAPTFSVSNPLGNLSGVPVLAVYQGEGDDITAPTTSYTLSFGGSATEVRVTTDGSDPSDSAGSGTVLSSGATTITANAAQWSTHIGGTMTIKARHKIAGIDVWSQVGQITVRIIEGTIPKPPTVSYVGNGQITFVPSEAGNKIYLTMSASLSSAPPAIQIPDDEWNNAPLTLPTSPGDNKNLRIAEARPWATVPALSDDTLFEFAASINSAVIGVLKYVPGGQFQRDSNLANVSRVDGLFMGIHEITQDQFEEIMGAGTNPSSTVGGTLPVTDVSWYHMIAFANKLSLDEGLTPVYTVIEGGSAIDFASYPYANIPTSSNAEWLAVIADWNANGYRLPTEMEWMWAAMGAPTDGQGGTVNSTGISKPFAGSNGSNNVTDYAWMSDNSGGVTHAVGTTTPNEIGLFDMTGNVWEFTWDAHDVWPDGFLDNYRGPSTLPNRSVHGGGFFNAAGSFLAIAYREGYPTTHYGVGFRLVRRP